MNLAFAKLHLGRLRPTFTIISLEANTPRAESKNRGSSLAVVISRSNAGPRIGLDHNFVASGHMFADGSRRQTHLVCMRL